MLNTNTDNVNNDEIAPINMNAPLDMEHVAVMNNELRPDQIDRALAELDAKAVTDALTSEGTTVEATTPNVQPEVKTSSAAKKGKKEILNASSGTKGSASKKIKAREIPKTVAVATTVADAADAGEVAQVGQGAPSGAPETVVAATPTKTKSSASKEGISLKAVAAELGIEKLEVYGFVKFLEALGLAYVSGKRKTSAGKGKPENLYSFSKGWTGELATKMKTFK